MRPADLDLFGSTFQAGPPAVYQQLRADGAVHYLPQNGWYLVTRAQTAREEAVISVQVLAGQIAALTVVDRQPPRYNASFMVRGLAELPVRVRRRPPA